MGQRQLIILLLASLKIFTSMIDFIDELRWRGMLHNYTEEIEEVLRQKEVVGYIGFDPTAPSLTIGNYIQVMILHWFQQAGHTPIVLMGGATGRIGDPSGKDKERDLKSFDELDKNLEHQVKQCHRNDREGQQEQNLGDEAHPDEHRHPEHGHAGRPHVHDRDEEVHRRRDRGHAEDLQANEPEVGVEAGAELG